MTTAFSDGARYNNLLPLTDNPYTFKFVVAGSHRTAVAIQDPAKGIAWVLWDAEIVLCHYLTSASNWQRFNGAVVVEVGAGTGLGAVVAWKLGAICLATDLPEAVESSTLLNMLHNVADAPNATRRKQLQAMPLSWGEDADALALDAALLKMGVVPTPVKKKPVAKKATSKKSKAQQQQQQQQQQAVDSVKKQSNDDDDDDDDGPKVEDVSNDDDFVTLSSPVERMVKCDIDFVIGADCIYDSKHHPILLRTLLSIMGEKTIFIFVHRKRFENDSNFISALMKHFRQLKMTPVAEVCKFPKDNVFVYEFVLPNSPL